MLAKALQRFEQEDQKRLTTLKQKQEAAFSYLLHLIINLNIIK
jgi:hypothetical protein